MGLCLSLILKSTKNGQSALRTQLCFLPTSANRAVSCVSSENEHV